MKLYEVIEKNPFHTRNYFTAKQNALDLFREIVTELKKEDVPLEPGQFKRNSKLSCTVNLIEVDTKLMAADWCNLLTSDAPGEACDVTPQDFIKTRKAVKVWESKFYMTRKSK